MTATRRRGAALEAAILDAGWDQLIEAGYSSFTFEAVAERAKTGKTAIYRRWPDKEALLLAIVAGRGLGTRFEVPDTGSLREDVLGLMRSLNRLGDSGAALLSTMLGAYFDETKPTLAQLRTQLLGDRSVAMAEVVRRAIERGELGADLPPRVLALPYDLLRHELIMNLGRATEETIVDIVDTVFLPLATQPRRDGGGARRAVSPPP